MFGSRPPALALLLTAVCACGMDEFGVLELRMDLVAMPPETLPEALPLDLEAFHDATGTIDVDTSRGSGSIDVAGLPELPMGFMYMPMLSFAEGARHDLPGSHHAGEEPIDFVADALTELTTPEQWVSVFTQADLGDVEIGALRSAMVMIMSMDVASEMPGIMVLAGELDFTNDVGAAAPAEGQGHSHGP